MGIRYMGALHPCMAAAAKPPPCTQVRALQEIKSEQEHMCTGCQATCPCSLKQATSNIDVQAKAEAGGNGGLAVI
jgi:hypothetical protein